ncbi:hypothetical protein CKO15_06075 [Halorhodospira abdelmalekii]|nr:hypothetical protein [Halorhodospira abdelmalekii]
MLGHGAPWATSAGAPTQRRRRLECFPGEQVFATLPQCYDISVRCIARARAKLIQPPFAAAAYNMRRLAFLREAGVTPF